MGSERIGLDVITVVTSPAIGFDLTRESVMQLHDLNPNVRWIVIVLEANDVIDSELLIAVRQLGDQLVHRSQTGRGIYGAMNEALPFVENDFFMFLNSGDSAQGSLVDQLPHLNNQRVHCYKSSWHDVSGISRNGPLFSGRVSFMFGKMPNHQAMVFPGNLSTNKYDETFPIAADQDMKLTLFCSQLLEFHSNIMVSSLVGGASSRKLKLHEVKDRYFESRKIFLRHYSSAWAEILGVYYGIRFLTRLNYSFRR